MISGPTIPNTLDSLRDLLIERVDLVEHGLQVLSQDLVLGHDATVDVLACDATGAPVLQFVAVPDNAARLPARVLGAQSWWRQNAAFLARELSDARLRVDLPPRFLVVGLDILADTLEELRRSRVDGLCVAQLCSFTIGGRLRVGLTVLLGAEARVSAPPRDGFLVPEGIVDAGQRALAARFLDLMRRVDAGLTAVGDRFSRRLFLNGQCVAWLGLQGGVLRYGFVDPAAAAADEPAELTAASCRAAVDRMLRLVLAGDSVGSAAAATDRSAGSASRMAPSAPAAQTSSAVTSEPDGGGDEERFSLEPIRRSVARAQLSREEFSALGGEGSDSE